MPVTEADLQKSIDDLSAAIDRKNALCEEQRASILSVLAKLRSQDTFAPSLLVIRQCIQELRRYEL